MGFGYILAGFLFLANPIVHVVDLIPDFIGFFLLCKGLNQISYMNDKLAEARELFKKLGFVELIRVGCIVFVPYTSDSATLLFAFVFGVVELIYFLPAINNFYDGLSYIGMRYNGDSVFAKKEKKRGFWNKENRKWQMGTQTVELGTALKRATIRFYFLRILCTLLPELTALQMYDYLGTVTAFSVNYARYKPFLYVILGLLVLIVGICWIVKLVQYYGSIRRDERFLASLQFTYDHDIAVKTELFVGKRMKNALFFYILAAAFSFCLYMDGVNIVLGLFSACFLSVAAILVGKDVKLARVVLPLSFARAVLSVVNFILQINYFVNEQYDEQAADWVTEAHKMYYQASALVIVENLFAIASFAVFAIALLKAVRLHLEQSGIQDSSVSFNKRSRDIEVFNAAGAKVLMNLILMLINMVLASLYMYVILNLGMITQINSIVTVIWLLHSISMVSRINELLYTPFVEEVYR